jgi:hypothetical protein
LFYPLKPVLVLFALLDHVLIIRRDHKQRGLGLGALGLRLLNLYKITFCTNLT